MYLDITLCKTPINTTDTLYFANATAQKAYFDGITEKEEFANSSYNGARSFRITSNYLEAINKKYNYMYFTYDNRTWYAFIDKYTYINDNVTEIEVTTDFVQTFMFDIQGKTSRVASFTWKNNHFNKFIPFSNKFPVSTEKIEKILSLVKTIKNTENKISFLAITVEKNFEEVLTGGKIYVGRKYGNVSASTNEFAIPSFDTKGIKSATPYANGIVAPYYTLFFPLIQTSAYIPIPVYNGMTSVEANETIIADVCDNVFDSNGQPLSDTLELYANKLADFINKIAAYIKDASIITSPLGGGIDDNLPSYPTFRTSKSYKLGQGKQITHINFCEYTPLAYGGFEPAILANITGGSDQTNINISLRFFISCVTVPNYEDEYEGVTTDGLKYSETNNYVIDYDFADKYLNRNPYKSLIFAHASERQEVEFSDYKFPENSKSLRFTIKQQYYLPFVCVIKVSVLDENGDVIDGYSDLNIFTLNNTNPAPYELTAWADYISTNRASVKDGLSTKHGYEKQIAKREMTNKTTQGAVGIAAGIASLGVGIGASGISKPIRGGLITGGIGQIISGAGSIADAQVAYENALTNMEKEKALLELSWSDIKSSPSEVNNLGLDIPIYDDYGLYEIGIYISEAANIDEVKQYHDLYGFQTEEIVEPCELTRQHQKFDYIRYEDFNFVSGLPQATHNAIKSIFESGIRFWYDIADFLNYDGSNPEYEV